MPELFVRPAAVVAEAPPHCPVLAETSVRVGILVHVGIPDYDGPSTDVQIAPAEAAMTRLGT